MLTIAAAPILIAEALPALAASELLANELGYLASSGPAWQSYVASSFSVSGMAQTSLYQGSANALANLGGQIAYNGFKIDENVNLIQPFFAASNGLVSNLGESSFKFVYNPERGFEFSTSTTSEFSATFVSNILGDNGSAKFSDLVRPVNTFTPVFTTSFDIIGGSVIETGENIIGDEIIDTLENNLQ